MLIEFDNKWCWYDLVFVDKDVFGFLRVGAIGFGEDDYCTSIRSTQLTEGSG